MSCKIPKTTFLLSWSRASIIPGSSNRGVSSRRGDNPGPSASGNTPAEPNGSTPPSSSSTPVTGHTSKSTSQERDSPRKRRRQEDEDDEDNNPNKDRAQKRQRVKPGERRLACPWQKRYHLQHFFCGKNKTTRGFDTIAHLKEHIRRCYLRYPVYCPKCKTEFSSSDARDAYILEDMNTTCEQRPFRDPTALSYDESLYTDLSKQVGRHLHIDDQWFSVWTILFLGVERPRSCRVDDDVCEHVLRIQQFVTARGDNIIREVIRDNDLIPEDDDSTQTPEERQQNGEKLEGFAIRLFGLALEKIFNVQPETHGQNISRQSGSDGTTTGLNLEDASRLLTDQPTPLTSTHLPEMSQVEVPTKVRQEIHSTSKRVTTSETFGMVPLDGEFEDVGSNGFFDTDYVVSWTNYEALSFTGS